MEGRDGHGQDRKDTVRERLYRLARDREGFLAAQARELPAEPEATLQTLAAALSAAVEQGDPLLAAEFSVGHARRVEELRRESPLDALRREGLDRARRLADLITPPRKALWYLLLAWELKDANRTTDARALCAAAAELPLGGLPDHPHYLSALLVGQVMELLPDDRAELARAWVPDRLNALCHLLIARGLFADAQRVARGISKEESRVEVLAALGEAQARGCDRDAAETFAEARRTATAIGDAAARDRALQAVALAHARVGAFAEALAVVDAIPVIPDPLPALFTRACVGRAQGEKGEAGAAELTLRDAREAARQLSSAAGRAVGLRFVAEGEALLGWHEQAGHTLSEALREAAGVSDGKQRATIRAGIALAQAIAQQAAAARQTFSLARRDVPIVQSAFSQTWGPDYGTQASLRNWMKSAVVWQAQEGLWDEAELTAEAIPDEWEQKAARDEIHLERARQETHQGRWDAALQALQAISNGNHSGRREGLCVISEAQLKAGERQAAQRNFAATLQAVQYDSEYYEYAGRAARSQIRFGDSAGARSTLAAALQRGETDLPHYEQCLALVAVAEALASCGGAAPADLLAEALQAARATVDQEKRDQALADVAALYEQRGEADAAQTIRAERSGLGTSTAPPAPPGTREIAEAVALAQAGQADAARQAFAHALELADPVTVAEAQARVGFGAEAVETLLAMPDGHVHFCPVGLALVEAGDRPHFLQLYFHVASHLDLGSALAACGYLAQLCPQDAATILTILRSP